MANDLALNTLLKVRDQASGQIGVFGAALKSLSTPAGIAGAALVGIGVATAIAVDKAQKYQTQILNLQTGAGELHNNLGLVSQGILDMSVKTATSTDQLTSGMFMIESAGFKGAQGLQVLDAASRGARVGAASLGTTADATTTILKDYFRGAADKATAAVNGLIATVQNGKTHMEDLAGSLSQILPTASAAGIGLNDVEAAMATMTGEGVPAANAATYLRQTILALEAPASGAKKTLASIGLTTSQISDEMKKSLPAALQMIVDHLKKKFPEGSAAYIAAIKSISGGSKTMQGMLDLTGLHMKDFTTNVGLISNAVRTGGKNIIGFSDVQKTFGFQMDAAKAAVNRAFIEIGTNLLPILTQLLSFLPGLIDAVMGFGKGIAGLVNWFINVKGPGEILRDLLLGIGAAILLIKIGSLVSAIPGLVVSFIAWAGAAGTAAIATLAAAAPIILIGSVIAVVVGGIILAVTHWGAITNWLKTQWMRFTSWFHSALSAVGSFFRNIWGGLTSFFQATWGVLQNIAKVAMGVILVILTGGLVLWVGLIVTHWNQIKSFLSKAWSDLIGKAKELWSKITGVFGGAWNALKQKVTDLGNNLKNFFGNLAKDALEWGKNILKMIGEGLRNAPLIGGIIQGVQNVAGWIKNFLGFHSPTKEGPGSDADTWGPNLMKMFESGVDSGIPALKQTLLKAAGTFSLLSPSGVPSLSGGSVRRAGLSSLSTGDGISLSPASGGTSYHNSATSITVYAGSANAKEVARELKSLMDKDLRRSGGLVTISSGGRATT